MKLFLMMLMAAAAACAPAAVQLEVPLHSGGFTIDGNITSSEKALCVNDTLRMATGYERPAHSTVFHVGATLQGLYIAFQCDEKDTSNIIALATAQGGAVFDDDSVQVFLCPDREINNSNYYHFAINPTGVQYSSNMADDSTVSGWTAKTLKSNTGWIAEIFIPFISIKAPQELKFWRANFLRNRPARQAQSEQAEVTSWQQVGNLVHNFQRFGFLQMPRLVPPPPGATTTQTAPPTATTVLPTMTVTTATISTTSITSTDLL